MFTGPYLAHQVLLALLIAKHASGAVLLDEPTGEEIPSDEARRSGLAAGAKEPEAGNALMACLTAPEAAQRARLRAAAQLPAAPTA